MNQRQSLAVILRQGYEREYSEVASVWRDLETKAQGNIATVGIFIAAISLVAGLFKTQGPSWLLLSVIPILLLLSLSALAALRALRVGKYLTICIFDDVEEWLREFQANCQKASEEKTQEALLSHINSEYRKALEATWQECDKKARWLSRAQSLMTTTVWLVLLYLPGAIVLAYVLGKQPAG